MRDIQKLTLFQAFRQAARRFEDGKPVVEDSTGGALTYRQLLTASRVLADLLAPRIAPGGIVAVLLPNTTAVTTVFVALQSAGRVPAMLNYTAGPATVVAACRTVGARQVIVARAFVEKAELGETVKALAMDGIEAIWLEDIAAGVGAVDKVFGFINRHRAVAATRPDDPALILFTSGSEGLPKGVVLSHRNILSNCAQVAKRIAFSPADKLFNVLPVFHSFGMTGGMVLPLVSGVRLYLYPSPLHYKIIPKTIARVRPTILFGTDTFLTGYARTAADGDFDSLRMVVAGAEAVRPETHVTWRERFHTIVLEGFGMTEAAPVVAVNTPGENRPGTVGKFLPDIETRIEPVEGIERGGRLWLRGPNVMLGYMKAGNPGVIEPPAEGWHDTGDVVVVDGDGYVSIRGRLKRFAKIAGEMVPLGTVEMLARQSWPDADHAVVSVPDKRKGEAIVLVTTDGAANREKLVEAVRGQGLSELVVPARIVRCEQIPLLGTGKIDYGRAREIALAAAGGPDPAVAGHAAGTH